MKIKKWLKVLVVLLLIAAFVFFVVLKYINKPNLDYTDQKPDLIADYQNLLSKIQQNDTNFIKIYTDKLITISGPVKKIKKDNVGYVIEIGNTYNLSSIICQMDDRHTNELVNIKTGETIKIKGKITGYNNDELLGVTVEMNFCIVDK